MGHIDRGDAEFALQAAQFLPQLNAGVEVEAARRLVEQQDVGIGCERPRQGDALLLAAAELSRQTRREVGQADEFEHAADPLLARRCIKVA